MSKIHFRRMDAGVFREPTYSQPVELPDGRCRNLAALDKNVKR